MYYCYICTLFFILMKKYLLVIIALCTSLAYAQINEIGVFAGGSNYVGDIGNTQYIHPNDYALGLLYRWNKSPRHAYRFSITTSQLKAKDSDSPNFARQERNVSFNTNLTELSAGMEFNFLNFNLHELTTKVTPYVYSGLSYSFYKASYFDNYKKQHFLDTQRTLAIPIVLGIKTTLTPKMVLGFEVGARYSFADDIDGSNPVKQEYSKFRFGNLNSNDWYVFSGFVLTYTFGEKPCYCTD